MHAYDDHQPMRGDLVKPVWIVDDDRSIRWVLEKALAREGIAYKTFASAHEVLAGAAAEPAAGSGLRHPHAGRIRSDAAQRHQGTLSACSR